MQPDDGGQFAGFGLSAAIEREEEGGLQVISERDQGNAHPVGGETRLQRALRHRAVEQAGKPAGIGHGRGTADFVARGESQPGRFVAKRPEQVPAQLLALRRPGTGVSDRFQPGAGLPRRVLHGVDGFERGLPPVLEGIAVDPGFLPWARRTLEDGVEKVDEVFDVSGGGGVFARPEVEPEIVAAQEVVDSAGCAVALLEAERIARRLRKGGVDQAAARGDERQQGVLVDGQFVLSAGEEAQARREPVRLGAGEQLNALV